jgi:hypothetical protein
MKHQTCLQGQTKASGVEVETTSSHFYVHAYYAQFFIFLHLYFFHHAQDFVKKNLLKTLL